ncbi:ATP synthase regulation protein NCA2-domain-containing protein [Scheffersomyces coipomensis]|uniref:ATP synthase regulation protein NCA2-domain-containing protein n=1 Tax=Scheffersomyces coipomensis TaxID=1788519 RepID=UPI00315DB329
MEFITPGIYSGTNRSSKVLREINNNNRISLSIKTKFNEINKLTTQFLTNELTVYSQQPVQAEDVSFQTLQKSFHDLYYLLNIEEFKFDKISTINIKKLQSIYDNLKDININLDLSVADNNDVSIINGTTLQLINYYMILTSTLNLSNSIILNTLQLKNDYFYWLSIKNSNVNKIIYTVQSLPFKIYGFSQSVFNHLEKLSTNNSLTILTTQGTEEDHDLYFNWIRVKQFSHRLYKAISKSIYSTFIINNPTVSLLNITTIRTNSFKYYTDLIKYIVKYPGNLINNDINQKLSFIKSQIDDQTDKIDQLIKTNLNDKESTLLTLESILSPGIPPSDNDIQRLNSILLNIIDFNTTINQQSNIPSVLARYWPVILIGLLYGPSQSFKLYSNRYEILNWIKFNIYDTTIGFFKNWVIKPVNEVLDTLRSDDSLSITTKESLKSDLDSLERMMLEFVQDNATTSTTDINPADIHNAIQNGDLTLVMNQYESQIRTPIKSLVKGNLIRSILIQIQKTKVDGGYAINGIDKILKSQQLVFGFVSLSPSLIILYQLYTYLTSSKPIFINGKQVNVICLKSLNNIENLLILLNQHHQDDEESANNYEGQLLIEIINLIVIADYIIPKPLKSDWIKDLNELNNNEFDIDIKLKLIGKIWNVYGAYFRS